MNNSRNSRQFLPPVTNSKVSLKNRSQSNLKNNNHQIAPNNHEPFGYIGNTLNRSQQIDDITESIAQSEPDELKQSIKRFE